MSTIILDGDGSVRRELLARLDRDLVAHLNRRTADAQMDSLRLLTQRVPESVRTVEQFSQAMFGFAKMMRRTEAAIRARETLVFATMVEDAEQIIRHTRIGRDRLRWTAPLTYPAGLDSAWGIPIVRGFGSTYGLKILPTPLDSPPNPPVD